VTRQAWKAASSARLLVDGCVGLIRIILVPLAPKDRRIISLNAVLLGIYIMRIIP
jgi:hypothetical protein